MKAELSEIVKIGVWVGNILSIPIFKRRNAWPLEIKVMSKSSSIESWRGVISNARYGYVDVEFRITPHKVPVYVQKVYLRYRGSWFKDSRTVSSGNINMRESEPQELVGLKVCDETTTPSYFTSFEISIPEGCNTAEIDMAVLVIESDNRLCEADLGSLHLKI